MAGAVDVTGLAPPIRLLGGFRLCDPTGHSIALPTRKCWALLAYLCQNQARDIRREALAALLWPDSGDTQARASLRQELAVLRHAMRRAGVKGIEAGKDRICFAPGPGVVDTGAMEDLLADSAPERWRAGIAFYGGGFLAGLKAHSGPFEDWQWTERQRLKSKVVSRLDALLQHDLDLGDDALAEASALRLLAIEPTQETGYRAMMRLLRRQGRRSDALRLFRQCTRVLAQELDAPPSRETAELAERIRQETAPKRPVAPAPPIWRDLFVLSFGLPDPADQAALRDAEQLAAAQLALSRYARAIVVQFGGLLLPGLGDRLLAVFGDRDTGGEVAAAACRAGLAICARRIDLADGTGLLPRAGLAFGTMQYSPPTAGQGAILVGDALSLAEALTRRGGAGILLASETVARRLGAGFDVKDVPTHATPMPDPGRVIGLRRD